MRGRWKTPIVMVLLSQGTPTRTILVAKKSTKIEVDKKPWRLTGKKKLPWGLQTRNKMAQQHGGVSPDENAQQIVDSIGKNL